MMGFLLLFNARANTFSQALKNTSSSCSNQILARFEKWKGEFGSDAKQ